MQGMRVDQVHVQWLVFDYAFCFIKIEPLLSPWNTFAVSALGRGAVMLGIEWELDMLLVVHSLIWSGRGLTHLHTNHEIGNAIRGTRKDRHAKGGVTRCLKTEQIEHSDCTFPRRL